MTRRWLLTLSVIVALALPGCSSELGTAPPWCPTPPREVSGMILVEGQAVPSAHLGPCLARLQPGWTAHDLHAESGRAWFWLDSDRLGDRFLTVTLQESCVTSGAEPGESWADGISVHTEIQPAEPGTRLAIVTVADRHLAYAQQLLGLLLEGGSTVRLDISDVPFAQRIQGALDAGEVVLIVDDADTEARTASVRTPDAPQDEIAGQTPEQILERFSADPNDETYRGTWYLTFEGGCIVYGFDAKGPGAGSLADEVRDALGFAPLEVLRGALRDAGYDI